jgi:hypothetical protein
MSAYGNFLKTFQKLASGHAKACPAMPWRVSAMPPHATHGMPLPRAPMPAHGGAWQLMAPPLCGMP